MIYHYLIYNIESFECESKLFFDRRHFKKLLLAGNYDEAENYLSNFTHAREDKNSMRLFFEINKHHYFDLVDR